MLEKIRRFFRSSKLDNPPMQSAEDAEINGLHTTLMREFYTIIGDDTGLDVTFEDGPDSFYEGLGDKEPTVDRLKALTDTDYKNILICARRILESDQVTEQHIRDVARVTLWHWKEEDTE